MIWPFGGISFGPFGSQPTAPRMRHHRSAIAMIPARANSSRVPHKNRKLFHGRPVIQYSIDAAKQSGLFDRIYVSTDDPIIMEIISGQDVLLHLRSSEYLCSDAAGTQEVARDWLLNSTTASFDYACVIYPAAPMMNAHDLEFGFRLLTFPPPSFGAKPYACVEGWYYWGLTSAFLQGIPLEGNCYMQGVTQDRYIDINTAEDWARAEGMYRALHPEVA